MKKTILFFAFATSSFIYSQETEFKLSKDGFTDFIVVTKEGKTSPELYNKTLDWVNKTYKNPEKVIVGKIENEYIRISGAKLDFVCLYSLGLKTCENARYELEISFKDGKYKLDVDSVELYTKPSQYVTGGWSPLPSNFIGIYKKTGELKPMFRDYPVVIPEYFNAVNKSLSDYISGTGREVENNNW